MPKLNPVIVARQVGFSPTWNGGGGASPSATAAQPSSAAPAPSTQAPAPSSAPQQQTTAPATPSTPANTPTPTPSTSGPAVQTGTANPTSVSNVVVQSASQQVVQTTPPATGGRTTDAVVNAGQNTSLSASLRASQSTARGVASSVTITASSSASASAPPESPSMGAGSVAGVVAGVLVGVIALIIFVVFIVKRSIAKRRDEDGGFDRNSFVRNSVMIQDNASAGGRPRPPSMIERHYNAAPAPVAQNYYNAPPVASPHSAQPMMYGQPSPYSPTSPFNATPYGHQTQLNRSPSAGGQSGYTELTRDATSLTPFQQQQYEEITRQLQPSPAPPTSFTAEQEAQLTREPSGRAVYAQEYGPPMPAPINTNTSADSPFADPQRDDLAPPATSPSRINSIPPQLPEIDRSTYSSFPAPPAAIPEARSTTPTEPMAGQTFFTPVSPSYPELSPALIGPQKGQIVDVRASAYDGRETPVQYGFASDQLEIPGQHQQSVQKAPSAPEGPISIPVPVPAPAPAPAAVAPSGAAPAPAQAQGAKKRPDTIYDDEDVYGGI